MTTAIVSAVVNKLGDLLIKEALFLQNVTNQIELVKLQLGQMQCFLKDAASKQKKDERVKGWVKDIRDVAYETEDAIDTFLDVMARGRLKGVGVFKKLARKPLELYARKTLGNKISNIQAKLNLISQGRTTFGIENLGDDGGEVRSVIRGPINPDDDSYEIVGFMVDKRNIINQLINGGSTKRRRVVSIVGQGGLGKTTLTQKVYNSNEIKAYFETFIWLTVSHDFKPIDLFKHALEKLRGVQKDELENNEEYFLREVNKSLKEKRYLIVLDDVWAYDSFARLERALPDVCNGSQVLITTRFVDIAKRADPASVPYELRFLTEGESLRLLLAKAFPYEKTTSPSSDLPLQHLMDVANQLAKKCGGLPLALVVLGGLLSIKAPTYNDWYHVLKTMDWSSDCNECMQILAMSYEDLPYSLKPCFLYLACFPEDFKIDARTLACMWIAEGFIIPKRGETLEDAANSCLEELVQRCMVQVSERSITGTIRYCRVHDLLRDLAINEAKEESFLSINPQENAEENSRARRVAIHFKNDDVMCHHTSKLRSLLIFNVEKIQGVKFRLLKVLELQKMPIKILPDEVTRMIHLRYLGLRGTKLETLPENIDRLQNLQTLDINSMFITSVPMSLWDITSLRYISSFRSINGPPKQANLTNLQTLSMVCVGEWEEGLPRLDNVTELGLDNKEDRDWNPAAQLLQNMEHLRSLRVVGRCLPECVINMNTFRSYKGIQSLTLDGEWPNSLPLNASQFPLHVTTISLSNSRLGQDPMQELKKLQSLKQLNLDFKAVTCRKIVCSPGGFHQLEILRLFNLDTLEEFYIEEGSLPALKFLRIMDCNEMRMLPDFHVIPTLRHLWLWDMPEEFVKRINPENGEDWHKIKHVPSININGRVFP